ncbi:PorP/SprF family type IX secretion system membrane protein [Lewinella sp. W8]|uniref:PorP/SprF family type IX secretion system membrane protein n=1 Tax=Lewinella sp. W8 TaxID=2528208 RepID=UPI0010681EB0|nr:PorP/SprF family type IX secretion system membrane protein [Lewinella sp. W8]MTB52202.1 type IX secretion system membrane protein PorP/SprF [Lewinella sp. W8]
MKRVFPQIIIFCLALATSFWTQAQDARYAQMAAAPQLMNPAMTGVMSGQLRITANYRELYTSLLSTEGYRSVGAGAEFRLPAGNGNYFGLGLQLQRDEMGSSDFVRTQGLVGLSYQQQVGGSRRRGTGHFLVGGGQVGFGQRGFDLNKVWFSQQYFVDPLTREAYLDQTLPTGEPIAGSGSNLYLDVNAGIGWFANLGDRTGAYFGGAVYHLTTPNVSPVQGNEDRLDRRYVIHGGGELPLGRGDMSLLPAARVMLQGPSQEILFGTNLRYTERAWREVALRVGLWGQMSNQTGGSPGLNALIVSAALETERLQFGVSYDISAGALNTVSDGRGGWELSVIYVQPASYRERVICPTF